VSKSTGRWFQLSAEYEVRYTSDVMFLVITMCKTWGLAKGLYGVCGWRVLSKNQTGVSGGIITQENSSSCAQPRVPIYVSGVDVAVKQDRHSHALKSGQVLSDKWAWMWEVTPKYFHRFACHCDLNGNSVQVVEAWNGHWSVDYTTADQDVCTVPYCQSVCAVPDIIGKPECLTMVKESLI